MQIRGVQDILPHILGLHGTYLKEGGQLAQFWVSFIEMTEILLNKIYVTRVGNWFLLLECYRDMMSYTFAYNHLNYARYLQPMLAELTEIEEKYPEVYTEKEFLVTCFKLKLLDRRF